MKKRIFIAVNLPDEIKRTLLSYEKRWKNLRVRWTNFNNMHITLEFLGNVDRKGLESVLRAVGETVSELKPFNIYLDRIILGPNLAQPRMFWAMVYIDSNVKKLKDLVEKNLLDLGFKTEEREFRPHITLARARGNQLKGKQTNIVLNNIGFEVESIEVMQSQLHPGGARYKVVESFKFGEKD
jgi:2'-5' RNA ligase